ncbi:MAG: M64 family metallo-endopeptidase [Verrucomicrobia bacterium]|nr:M64 family metallo-endopeptidase [Verrucomicrobiota bacterium]
MSNGPSPNRVNLVVLSEGYTTAQLPQFLSDATDLVNNFLAEEPYQEYRRFFNAFAIAVASTQSGSDHPSQSYYRDTYFNSSYDTYGDSSFVTIPPNPFDANYSHGQGKVDSLLQQFLPACDLAMLLVNDPLYGGAGGSVLIASKGASSAEIVRHESGHSLAGLGDEYEDAYPGYPDVEEPNTTRETRRAFIKWAAWISTNTPVPTPETDSYADVVGLFEGAHYHTSGWFRPKLDCKMRTLNVPFCEVCREALIKSVYVRVSPLDSFSPAGTNLAVTSAQVLTFSVFPIQPLTHSVSVEWYTNEARVTTASNTTFSVPAATLGLGQRTVRVVARDTTAWVRNDPANLLQASVEWAVSVESAELRLQAVRPAGSAQGPFTILVQGPGTNRFVVLAASGLTNWQPLATNSLSGGRFTFYDTNASGFARRFYRAMTTTP